MTNFGGKTRQKSTDIYDRYYESNTYFERYLQMTEINSNEPANCQSKNS